MNLCHKGHDKDVVGRFGRRCAECKRIANRANAKTWNSRRAARLGVGTRRAPCTHPGECQAVQSRTGARYCAVQRRFAAKTVNPGLDGLEPEYGPVPAAPRVWIDRVVLERRLRGEAVGRTLTPGEVRALHILKTLERIDDEDGNQERVDREA